MAVRTVELACGNALPEQPVTIPGSQFLVGMEVETSSVEHLGYPARANMPRAASANAAQCRQILAPACSVPILVLVRESEADAGKRLVSNACLRPLHVSTDSVLLGQAEGLRLYLPGRQRSLAGGQPLC